VEIGALLATLPVLDRQGTYSGEITLVTHDSQRVVPGACFVAIAGRWTDGHQYIPDALARGAALVVGQQPTPADFPADRVYVRVSDPRRELARLSAAFYGNPSQEMAVIGVTGTDGKTTTTRLIDALLTADGARTGYMTTVDFKVGDEKWPNNTRFTVLEAPDVQAFLRRMADAGVERAVLETTSSALELHRVADVAYDVAVVTNITSEHIEVHGSLAAYRRAKATLFEMVDPDAHKPLSFAIPHACVLNADDSSFQYLKPFCRAPILSYGIDQPADVRAEQIALEGSGTRFRVCLPGGVAFDVATPLVARFNVYNCLAAIAVAHLHGITPEVIAATLAQIAPVSGRMERIVAGQPFSVVVDYAHTAESLAKVLDVLRPITTGRLIAVFGSAGDRDRVKRPEMGGVAARKADFAVITDEDPREEDAMSILHEIAAGAEEAGACEGERYVCIVGRREAIATAFRMARPGDTVLLAGKGHEQSLIVGRQKLPWDDRLVAREELAALGFADSSV
jgi:UDP-N-acetylmuramoyl-L-alanyl-D-glutamate--2,6-diaminopimelate ligase